VAEIGQLTPALITRPLPAQPGSSWAILAVLVAGALALSLWHFGIDDALISIRYARHLALGQGYRFDVHGPVTDGVTPLAWPFLLWPLAHGAPLVVLARAKALGLFVWLATALVWGRAVGRTESSREAKLAALLGMGVCVPLAAHAVSGMETPVATALATVAALQGARPRTAALLAGLAASLRPELVPWAMALSMAFAAREPRVGLRVLVAALVAIAPFVACSLLRVVFFGSQTPLSLLAKPSDLSHGVSYAVAAGLASVGPLMAAAPLAAPREKGPGRAIALSGGVHLVAVAIAGGDWMPFARLVAPVVPSLLYASVLLWPHSSVWVARGRAGLAILVGAYVLVFAAPAGRRVGLDREELVLRMTPLLAGRERIASVDVGWLSAATEADIVDLAGVTDPEVAALGGGHTSKRIDGAFLLAKHPDTLVLLAPPSDLPLERWADASFSRVVEARLAADPLVEERFVAVAFVPLGREASGYYVLFALALAR
jgi:hypothetical protein